MALSDEELMAKYHEAGGRPHGTVFADELFQRHYSRVALWCLRISGDRDKAADLAQEVFAKAWAHLDHFRAESKFSTWLYTIARNHCFTRLKRDSLRQEDVLDPSDFDLLSATAPGFVGELERAGQMEMAQGLMASELNSVETQVMTLHYAQELPLDAISRLLQLDNASGAKAYIVSAKRKLKSALERLHKASEPRRRGNE
jgi:RNA polymerase sigma-70 factor, ECF subfamily